MSSEVVCKFWAARGSCFYGAECKFLHPTVQTSKPVSSDMDQKPSAPANPTPTFKEFVPRATPVATPVVATPAGFSATAREFVPTGSRSSSPATVPASNDTANGYDFHNDDSEQQEYDYYGDEAVYDTTLPSHPLAHAGFLAEDQFMSADEMTSPFVASMAPLAPMQMPTAPQRAPPASTFVGDYWRRQMQRRCRLTAARLMPDDPRVHDLPESVGDSFAQYHSLLPLELPGGALAPPPASSALKVMRGGPTNANATSGANSDSARARHGHVHTVYKVTGASDGVCYALRRFEGCRLNQAADAGLHSLLRPWVAVSASHASMVALRRMFGSSDFGDSGSLCSVTDFYPGAQTLQARYFSQPGPLLPEEELWSIFMQLLSALTAIHSAGLAYRLLLPSNILVTNADDGAASAGGATGVATCRVRLNSVGIMDALDAMHGVAAPPLPEAQYADLVSLARIMVNLACMSPHAADNLGASLEFIGSQRAGGADMRRALEFILRPLVDPAMAGMPRPCVFDLTARLHHRLMAECAQVRRQADSLEHELSKEWQNGRLLRLAVKLAACIDRPEHEGVGSDGMSKPQSETSERFLIKLFRNFVYHQQHEDGSPNLDFGHVVYMLNKLDAGSSERVAMMGRDEEHLMVVSFADVKRCVDGEIADLRSRARSAVVPQHQAQQAQSHPRQQAQSFKPTSSLLKPASTPPATMPSMMRPTAFAPAFTPAQQGQLPPQQQPMQSQQSSGLFVAPRPAAAPFNPMSGGVPRSFSDPFGASSFNDFSSGAPDPSFQGNHFQMNNRFAPPGPQMFAPPMNGFFPPRM